TFSRMRQLSSNLGVNLDPSHFFWQSMDPVVMVEALGDRIGHAHGKDTTLHARRLALNGVLDTRWPNPPDEMPWNFATVGRGHDKEWWRTFVRVLRDQGFKGTISIEYEDPFVPVEESVLESERSRCSVTRRSSARRSTAWRRRSGTSWARRPACRWPACGADTPTASSPTAPPPRSAHRPNAWKTSSACSTKATGR